MALLSLRSTQAQSYQQTVDNYYAARPVERIRLSLDERQFLLHLQATHPEIEKISLLPAATFGKAELKITARKPIARWSISDGRQYVDAKGVVFERNYYKAPSLRIIDNSGLQRDNGQILASNRFLGFVGQAAGQIEDYGFTVRQVTIPSQTTRQIELRLKGSKERYIVSVDRTVGDQVEDIARVASHLRDKDIHPSYVDVRVAGKAFYK